MRSRSLWLAVLVVSVSGTAQAARPPRAWKQVRTESRWATDERSHYRLMADTGAGSADVAGRTSEITVPKTPPSAALLVGGHTLPLTQQIELERRTIVDGWKGTPKPLPGLMRRRDKKPLATHRDLVLDVLDRFVVDGANSTSTGREGQQLFITPLRSRYQHAHMSGQDNGYLGPIELGMTDLGKTTQFTRELQGNALHLDYKTGKQWATIQRNYIVGLQHESGVYYDTPDQALRQQGKALREKRWHPIDEEGRVGAATASGLFVKQQVSADEARADGLPIDQFTARRETHVALPSGIAKADKLSALAQLAQREGLSAAQAASLRPTVRVETDRASVELMWKTDPKSPLWSRDPKVKVGFLTIDRYSTVSLLPGQKGKRSRPIVQFELELLPEGHALQKQNPAEFQRLFDELEQAYGAKIDVLPKYQHGLPGPG